MVPNDDIVKLGETAEPLGDGFYIIQRRDVYRFGSDAVALAKFASKDIRRGFDVLDLCSGCGVVGILVAIATGARVLGAELDETLFDMSVRSVKLNGLCDVRFVNADLREVKRFYPNAENGIGPSRGAAENRNRFSAVVCNPPYYRSDSKPSAISPAANSELTVAFRDVAETAANSLGQGGAAYFVHTAGRLDEVLCECRALGLTPKKLIVNVNGKTFMLKCVKGGKSGLTVTTEEF